MLYTDSYMFRWICEAAEKASFDQNICIDLNLHEACYNEGIIRTEEMTGNRFVMRRDLQRVASIYADFNVINY